MLVPTITPATSRLILVKSIKSPVFEPIFSATYVPAAIFCGVAAQKSPKVLEYARRVAQRRLDVAKTAVWRPKARQKRWTKLIKKAEDENRRFWFGFSLGNSLL